MSEFGTVDVCLTATNVEIAALRQTLESIFHQTYDDVRISLYLSREPFLFDNGVFSLPPGLAEIKNNFRERLRVEFTPDIARYRKLLPYLQENWGRSKLVVTADPDTIYPEDWLLNLLSAYRAVGCSVAYRGHQIVLKEMDFAPYEDWLRSTLDENPSQLIVPIGGSGILYDTAFFPRGVLDIEDALKLAPASEDLWFRWHLAMNGIAVYVIDTRSFAHFYDERSLNLQTRRFDEHNRAIADLDQYFRDVHGFDLKSVNNASRHEQPVQTQLTPCYTLAGNTSEYAMVSDPFFEGVSLASKLPAKLELSEHWTFALKGHDPSTRGEIKREPLDGLTVTWEGTPKLVQLWQDLELRALQMGPVTDVEVTLTIQCDGYHPKLVDYVALERKADIGGLRQKLRLRVSRAAQDQVFTIRAKATAMRLEQEEYILRIQFNKDPKSIVLRSIHGKIRWQNEEPAEEIAPAFSISP